MPSGLLESLQGKNTTADQSCLGFFYTQNNSRDQLLGPQVWLQLPDFCTQSAAAPNCGAAFGDCAAVSPRGEPCQGKKEIPEKKEIAEQPWLGTHLPFATKPLSETGFYLFLCQNFRGCAGTIWEIMPGAVLLRTNRSSEHSQDTAERTAQGNQETKLCSEIV